MIKQNIGKRLKEFVISANAPLEYLFNNHEYCDIKWCNVLNFAVKGNG